MALGDRLCQLGPLRHVHPLQLLGRRRVRTLGGRAHNGNVDDNDARAHVVHVVRQRRRRPIEVEGLHDQRGDDEGDAPADDRLRRGHGLGPAARRRLLRLLLGLRVGVLGLVPRGLLLIHDGLAQRLVRAEGPSGAVAHAGQGAIVALREAVVHLVVPRVRRVREGQVDGGVEGEVVADVQDRPADEAGPGGAGVNAHRLVGEVQADDEDREAVHLLQRVLVRGVRVAAEGHELAVVLLVAVGVECTPVCHKVEGVVNDVVDEHHEHEGQRPVEHGELPQAMRHRA
mmetsp:Transcript_61530/g.158755  ORF Transcript_61530/g.158755 Transcript_61530/m.158755 type:complete len:286 (+) Transcript_61530:632-1489(+)